MMQVGELRFLEVATLAGLKEEESLALAVYAFSHIFNVVKEDSTSWVPRLVLPVMRIEY